MKWKDCTSYRRGEERKPRSFDATAGSLRIVLTSQHIYCPGEWSLTTYPKFFDCYPLGIKADESVKKAQKKAIVLIATKLKEIIRDL